jgi:uncharacterized protein (TIGR02145 family)
MEKDTSRQLYLNVIIYGYPKSYLVFDIDSIVFKIDKWQPLTIGTQVWMLKNLNVDHFRNGDSIPEVRDNNKWPEPLPAWCYYNNDPSLGLIYGKLYNGKAVDEPRGLAPKGWHIASKNEWYKLIDYVGGSGLAGGKLKETSLQHWNYTNNGVTNEYGFTALPGGSRYMYLNPFSQLGTLGMWWTSDIYSYESASSFEMSKYGPAINVRGGTMVYGLSVRCIKD